MFLCGVWFQFKRGVGGPRFAFVDRGALTSEKPHCNYRHIPLRNGRGVRKIFA